MTTKHEKQDKHKWHSIEADKVLDIQNSDKEKGLTDNEVKVRTEKYGLNEIPKGKKQSWFVRLLMQFHNVLI